MKNVHAIVLVALVACTKKSGDAPADAAAAASASPPPSSSVAVDTSKLSRPPTPRDDARNLVLRWNDALDRHDVAALESVYAPKVDLYGTSMARAAAIEAKKGAFKATPTFRQSIAGPIVLEQKGNEWIATFTKRSGAEGKQKDASAKVVVASAGGGGLAVTVETDAPSEKKAAAAGSCEALAERTANELPQVKKLLADDEKALGKNDHIGGMGPEPVQGGGLTGSIGVHHPDRFESQVVYDVDAKGKLTVMVMGEDVAVPPAALAAVAKACAGK